MNAKILIVDDSTLARRTTRRTLEAMGHVVDEATDGITALERYCINRPDIVILDLVMSGMYGLEVLAKMREFHPEARVIIATADIQQATHDQVRAAGAAALINKPLDRGALTEVVEKVLEGRTAWN